MTALPLIGSGLGLVSKIGGGIAGLFKTKGARKAQQVFGGIGSVGNAISGGGSTLNEGIQRAGGLVQGAQNMIDRGREAVGYGRDFAGGMRDAFRRRDYVGMMNQASEGINRFGRMGQGMAAEGMNLYDQGRQAADFGRGAYTGMRNQYQSGQNMVMGRQGPANGITPESLKAVRLKRRPVRF
jgi:hypothetical protein